MEIPFPDFRVFSPLGHISRISRNLLIPLEDLLTICLSLSRQGYWKSQSTTFPRSRTQQRRVNVILAPIQYGLDGETQLVIAQYGIGILRQSSDSSIWV